MDFLIKSDKVDKQNNSSVWLYIFVVKMWSLPQPPHPSPSLVQRFSWNYNNISDYKRLTLMWHVKIWHLMHICHILDTWLTSLSKWSHYFHIFWKSLQTEYIVLSHIYTQILKSFNEIDFLIVLYITLLIMYANP